jgi:hypothetical protein
MTCLEENKESCQIVVNLLVELRESTGTPTIHVELFYTKELYKYAGNVFTSKPHMLVLLHIMRQPRCKDIQWYE